MSNNIVQRRKGNKNATKNNGQSGRQSQAQSPKNQENQKVREQMINSVSWDAEKTSKNPKSSFNSLTTKSKQQKASTSSSSSSTSSSSTSSSSTLSSSTSSNSSCLCCSRANSGSFITCCSDINCRLNSKPLNVLNSNTQHADRDRRSVSVISHESTVSSNSRKSHTPSPFEKESSPGFFESKERVALIRDSSPDSGVDTSIGGLDTERLKAYFDQKHIRAIVTERFTVDLKLDLLSWLLFLFAFVTRFYKLSSPPSVVFDESHFGKFICHYMKNIFFFDLHPPLGKQLIVGVLSLTGFDGNCSIQHIGQEFPPNFPIFWMRFVPALCGSLLVPTVYKLLLTSGLKRMWAALGGVLIILDNSLLTQSRFILMETMMILFSTSGIYFLLHLHRTKFPSFTWLWYGLAASISLTSATSVKYVGVFSFFLAAYLICRHYWYLLFDPRNSNFQLWMQTFARFLLFVAIPLALYLGMFYVHLSHLYKAGPHDSAMTSAFQASLDGGLASITKGQPLKVAHGSQITLRNTHGRTCWLHSHPHVYPVKYPDKRGSSHQQQVTCYSFKDVNNWWIVKRPKREDLVVDDQPDAIRHGDIIQLVHGITSRALNSHDVAAPMTPSCQEVSCYIDYEIKMKGELLWQVDILNRDKEGDVWHAIKSQVRLIHKTTKAALRFTGRLLPEWGFNQHEVVADRTLDNSFAIWNVEEHRYTKTQDQKERERQLLRAEMIPTQKTKLTFFEKFIELQSKMLWHLNHIQNHVYSSEPYEWPLMTKGIAYWADPVTGAQIHLLGNVLIWYSASFALFVFFLIGCFYLLRRRRLCFDIPEEEWLQFLYIFDIYFIGYLIHYLPYYFLDRTLFLYNYLPAFVFKLCLLCYVFEHIEYLLGLLRRQFKWLKIIYRSCIGLWLLGVVYVFIRFWPLSNGLVPLNRNDLLNLRWKDTWDLILI